MDPTLGHTVSTGYDRRDASSAFPPRPHLFRVFACDRPLGGGARHSLAELDVVTIGRGEAGANRSHHDGQRHLAIRLPDSRMSSTHARLVRALGRWLVEDAGSRNGTLLNGAPALRTALCDGDLLEVGRTFFLFRAALPTPAEAPSDLELDGEARAPLGLATLVPGFAAELGALARVATSTISVLLHGESGTGKEVVARALHAASQRAGAFVAVNCGALPATLVESELFGYRKGAFSGAVEDRPGLVRSADRGTLLLDEIGDLPLTSQVAFLRVLQEREVLPVGGTRAVSVDLRVCAATHRDLQALVAEGRFRADLYARLSGFGVRLPPLRERREDLGLLCGALLGRVAGSAAATVHFSREGVRALLRHGWPLNVRELEKCLEVAVVLAAGAPIELSHLPEAVRSPAAPEAASAEPLGAAAPDTPDDAQRRQELTALLSEHEGNLTAVARAMGKDRVQIRRWLQRLRIDPDSFRRPR